MSGGTFVPRNECPGGHFFQGDSHSSDTVVPRLVIIDYGSVGDRDVSRRNAVTMYYKFHWSFETDNAIL